MKNTACPNCGRNNLYSTYAGANGGHGPALLPSLGAFMRPAQMEIVVCADCGLTRFFAGEEERARLRKSSRWTRV